MQLIGKVGDLMLSYGERGRREQIRRGVPPDKILVLSTAIDQREVVKARNSVTADRVDEFRRRQRIGDNEHILLHVTRITAIKNPAFMVRCFAELTKRRNDVLLVWIGGGPLEETTKKLAAAAGIFDRMRFLGPIYDESELALWFKSASLFVMATAVGLSMHHAMCYGLPVVTDDSDLTHPPEIEVLQNGVNGLLYRNGSVEDFALKVCRLLDDKTYRSILSANAIHRIENEYTLERKVHNFADAINRLTEMASKRARAGSSRERPGWAE
jgi:glycosyltransferase involved in cell wall biosynthesis